MKKNTCQVRTVVYHAPHKAASYRYRGDVQVVARVCHHSTGNNWLTLPPPPPDGTSFHPQGGGDSPHTTQVASFCVEYMHRESRPTGGGGLATKKAQKDGRFITIMIEKTGGGGGGRGLGCARVAPSFSGPQSYFSSFRSLWHADSVRKDFFWKRYERERETQGTMHQKRGKHTGKKRCWGEGGSPPPQRSSSLPQGNAHHHTYELSFILHLKIENKGMQGPGGGTAATRASRYWERSVQCMRVCGQRPQPATSTVSRPPSHPPPHFTSFLQRGGFQECGGGEGVCFSPSSSSSSSPSSPARPLPLPLPPVCHPQRMCSSPHSFASRTAASMRSTVSLLALL